MAERKLDGEAEIKRNPHPDFKKVEASRPVFSSTSKVHFVQTPKPDWTPGAGSNTSAADIPHREIDPYATDRPAVHNYKLLISGIAPRPIGFVSTVDEKGESTNLAPFSYFNLVNHDPPLFVLGFSGGFDRPKDSLKNLVATKECVLNIISEDFIEAANYCSLNAPAGISEWGFAGLHPAKSSVVKPDRVKEAVFSIEAVLVETREWESKAVPRKKTGVMAVVEGVKFWVREDALDETGLLIKPEVLRPVCRLGGIMYGRVTELFELPRPMFEEITKDEEVAKLAKPKVEGQLE